MNQNFIEKEESRQNAKSYYEDSQDPRLTNTQGPDLCLYLDPHRNTHQTH